MRASGIGRAVALVAAFAVVEPIDIRLQIPSTAISRSDRYREAATNGLQVLSGWFGPYPFNEVTIVDRGWRRSTAESPAPGGVTIATRWLAPGSTHTLEHEVLVGLARQFWDPRGTANRAGQAWLVDGLSQYSAERVIEEMVPQGRATEGRYFGGFVAYPIRSETVTPCDVDHNRTALAFCTLERYLGWSTLQQALLQFADRRKATDAGLPEFFAIVQDVSGRDLRWFADEAFDASKTFDYGVESLVTRPSGNGTYETTLTVRRFGIARFHARAAIEALVQFADGSEVREQWDGREALHEYAYESAQPATGAVVDPDNLLPLDTNRANNELVLNRPKKALASWSASWLVSLQDAMLTYGTLF